MTKRYGVWSAFTQQKVIVKCFDKIPLRSDAVPENEGLQSPTTSPLIARKIITHQMKLLDLVYP